MSVGTSPNPIYIALQQQRHGCVDPFAWAAALKAAGSPPASQDGALARRNFNKIRRHYWRERLRLAAESEFNAYNQARMRVFLAPIGPDGFSMELEHRTTLKQDPLLALEPSNLWEIFRRQHDFQHGDVAVRWHLGSMPQSPHAKNLPMKHGDAKQHQHWP
jgi:hypothetical protein